MVARTPWWLNPSWKGQCSQDFHLSLQNGYMVWLLLGPNPGRGNGDEFQHNSQDSYRPGERRAGVGKRLETPDLPKGSVSFSFGFFYVLKNNKVRIILKNSKTHV